MLLLFTACKKDDDNNTAANTFTLGNTAYPVFGVSAASGGPGMIGYNSNGSISIMFKDAFPTTSGMYKVVYSPSAAMSSQYP